MRELSAYIRSVLAEPVSRPRWLLSMVRGDEAWFLSSNGVLELGDRTWLEFQFKPHIRVGGFASTSIADPDGLLLRSFMASDWLGAALEFCYLPIADRAPAPGDEYCLFDGSVNQWSHERQRIEINASRVRDREVPAIRITEATGFKHLPPQGTRFVTTNGVVTLTHRQQEYV